MELGFAEEVGRKIEGLAEADAEVDGYGGAAIENAGKCSAGDADVRSYFGDGAVADELA